MDIIFWKSLKLGQAKTGRLAVELAQWEPVDLPLKLSICLNASYNKVWHMISYLFKACGVIPTILPFKNPMWLELKADESDT